MDYSQLNPNANWFGAFPGSGLAQAPQAPRTLDTMAPQTNVQTQTTQQPPSGGAPAQFNTAIMGLLQKYQQLGTKPFVEQGLNAQQAQNDRISAPTSADMIGAAPGLQNSVRNGQANALDPIVQSANNSAQTFGEQLKSFGSAVDSAKSFMSDYQNQQDKAQDNARNVIHEILTTTDPTSLHDLSPDEINTLEKTAGYPKGFLSSAVTYKQKQDALAAKKAASSGGSNLNVSSDNERALLSQFNGLPIVKDYNTILSKKLSVDAILSSGVGGPGDLSAVYEFMKALDPSSVVRETEYATAAASGNIFQGIYARFNGYLKDSGGFLPANVKSAFQSVINSKLKVQTDLYNNTKKQYEALASRQGLNPQNVVIDYGAAAGSAPASSGNIITAPDGQQIEIVPDTLRTPNTTNIQSSAGLFGK